MVAVGGDEDDGGYGVDDRLGSDEDDGGGRRGSAGVAGSSRQRWRDGKKVIVTESSVRMDLQLADEDGIDLLKSKDNCME
ncbi:hypothetical protein Tco_1325088 [Tanacetum coccineum]